MGRKKVGGRGGEGMEFGVDVGVLRQEIALLASVAARESTVPILSQLLVEAREADGKVVLTATNLDMNLRVGVTSDVRSAGAATVPAKKLAELLRLLPDENARVKAKANGHVSIDGEHREFELFGMAKQNFPTQPAEPADSIPLDAGLVARLIAKTSYAVSYEESRYTLRGALLILKSDSVAMVATDGHRLAVAEADVKTDATKEIRAVIPIGALNTLSRLIKAHGEGATVEFSKADPWLFFRVGDRLLSARQVEGNFPTYEAVLPRDNSKQITVDGAQFLDVVRRVGLMADKFSRAMRFALDAGRMEVSAENPEYGRAREVVEKEYTGEPVSVTFNAGYLLDFLQSATAGPVSVELNDSEHAGQFRPLADDGLRVRYVVMPMRADVPSMRVAMEEGEEVRAEDLQNDDSADPAQGQSE